MTGALLVRALPLDALQYMQEMADQAPKTWKAEIMLDWESRFVDEALAIRNQVGAQGLLTITAHQVDAELARRKEERTHG